MAESQQIHAPAAPQSPPACPPVVYHAEPIPKVMLEVLFESEDVVVLRGVLTADIYTLDKSRNIVIEEPTEQELWIFDHLSRLGIKDRDLNLYHWDTLRRLYDLEAISDGGRAVGGV